MANYTYKNRNIGRAADMMQRNNQLQIQKGRSKIYNCTDCSKCNWVIVPKTVAEAGLIADNCPVDQVLDMEVNCDLKLRDTQAKNRVLCEYGDRTMHQHCASCKYGKQIILPAVSDNPKITEYMMLYLCKNRKHQEQYTKETAAKPYVCCEFYEEAN